MRVRPFVAAIVVCLAIATLSQATEVERARYLMGTVCTITAPSGAEQQIAAAFDEAARIEAFLSTWRDDSELSKLNRSGEAQVSPELFSLLRTAASWQPRTGGAFSPLMAPLIAVWRTRADGVVPDARTIERAGARVGASNVSFDSPATVRLADHAAFEEGGFGKGYAIDRMLALLPQQSVVNFGGQLGIRGTSIVSIADPEHRDRPVLSFSMSDGSLATSSGSEKTFEVAGRRFSHIIDPRTGQALPPRGSASVIFPDALTADILSTALYVMGPEEGLPWAEAHGVAALFIGTNHEIRMSSEFRRRARSPEALETKFKSGESK